MKKIITIFLALCMVLSFSICAFAATENPDAACGFDDESTVTISKNYSLTREDTVSPEESFIFTVEKEECKESYFYTLDTMPMFSDSYDSDAEDGKVNFKIDYAEGEAKLEGDINTFVLNLPTYDHVGVFTYKVTEAKGNTAGVTYDEEAMYFTVTVLDDGEGNMVRVCSAPYKPGPSGRQEGQEFRRGRPHPRRAEGQPHRSHRHPPRRQVEKNLTVQI